MIICLFFLVIAFELIVLAIFSFANSKGKNKKIEILITSLINIFVISLFIYFIFNYENVLYKIIIGILVLTELILYSFFLYFNWKLKDLKYAINKE